jgi:recombination protein RecR
MQFPPYLNELISILIKINGIGYKVATKIAIALTLDQNGIRSSIISHLNKINNKAGVCFECGNLIFDNLNKCTICRNKDRIHNSILIIENIETLFLFESLNEFKGLYHITYGLISPINGVTPEKLNINSLIERLNRLTLNFEQVELIFGFNSSIEAQSTITYIISSITKNISQSKNILFSKLASGIPPGSEIESLPNRAISESLKNRVNIEFSI